MVRTLVVGYVFGIRSERALCREVQVNLAYRWFCGLGIEDEVPDHSVVSRERNERFRDHDTRPGSRHALTSGLGHKRTHAPQYERAKKKDRLVVVYSPESRSKSVSTAAISFCRPARRAFH
jgi:Transposase domain (DUF772)